MCLSLAINIYNKSKIISDKLDAFYGKSRHVALSENYFSDSTYRNFIKTFSNERKRSKYKHIAFDKRTNKKIIIMQQIM